MRVMCKPGSVGDLGGQPPRSTRPEDPRPRGPPRTPNRSDPEDPQTTLLAREVVELSRDVAQAHVSAFIQVL